MIAALSILGILALLLTTSDFYVANATNTTGIDSPNFMNITNANTSSTLKMIMYNTSDSIIIDDIVNKESSINMTGSGSNSTNGNMTGSGSNSTNGNMTASGSNSTNGNMTASGSNNNKNLQDKPDDGTDPIMPKDATIMTEILIKNNCHHENLCSNVDAYDLFDVKVFLLVEPPEVLDVSMVPGDNLFYVTFPVENDESMTYTVKQVRKNFALLPWKVSSTEYSNCNNSIKSGENKTCTITITLSEKDSKVGYLNVKTDITNNCYPNYMCNNLHANTLFSNQLYTLTGASHEKELEMPGSEKGWTIKFYTTQEEGPVQYDIKQVLLKNKDIRYKPWNVELSPGCTGEIVAGSTVTCTISNIFGDGNLNVANLNISTQINNEWICKPASLCNNIQVDNLFSNHVYTFQNNEYEDKFDVPSSERGWVVQFYPSRAGGVVQYDVKQSIADSEDSYPLGPWDVTYSQDCHGTLKSGETKKCIIENWFLDDHVYDDEHFEGGPNK